MSLAVSGGKFNLDNITNGPGNTPSPIAIPQAVISGATGGATYSVNVTWTAISNLKGYYDAAPTNNIITGVCIRYYNGASAPTDFTTGAWIRPADGSGDVIWGTSGTDPGLKNAVQIPAPGAGTQTWLAISVLFDGQTPTASPDKAQGLLETNFVGARSASALAPTGAGTFGAVNADLTGNEIAVSWNSNVESNVAKYEVYWGLKKVGPFQLVATVPPQGNGQGYRVSFTPPGATSPGAQFVKIKAVKTDGGEEWSQLIRIGGNRPAQDK